jgi:hypothetical protein
MCINGCCPVQCPEGQACDGFRCLCVSESCCSGVATACDYTSAGQCCTRPTTATACADSRPGAGDGWVRCCTWGVDCPPCASVLAIASPAEPGCAHPGLDAHGGCVG